MCVLGKRIRCTQGKFYSNWWKLGTSEMKIKWNKKKEQKTTKRNSQANGKGVCACVGVCLYAIWSHKNRVETLKLSAKMQKRVKDVKTKAYIIIRYRYNKKQWCAMLNTLHMVKVYYFSPIRKRMGIIDNAMWEYKQTQIHSHTFEGDGESIGDTTPSL